MVCLFNIQVMITLPAVTLVQTTCVLLATTTVWEDLERGGQPVLAMLQLATVPTDTLGESAKQTSM